nr:hypothetical protein [Ganoderma leucocontextum]
MLNFNLLDFDQIFISFSYLYSILDLCPIYFIYFSSLIIVGSLAPIKCSNMIKQGLKKIGALLGLGAKAVNDSVDAIKNSLNDHRENKNKPQDNSGTQGNDTKKV